MPRTLTTLSNAGGALGLFIIVTVGLLWATGTLHLGSASGCGMGGVACTVEEGGDHAGHDHDASVAAADPHAGHDHGPGEHGAEEPDGEEHGAEEDWCTEHGVPESACVRCDPSLVAVFQARGDWCAGHGVPESLCVACGAQVTPPEPEDDHAGHDHGAGEDDDHAGHDHGAGEHAATVDWCAEHQVPESACVRCDPSLVAVFQARGDWCAGHGVPESVCVDCGATVTPPEDQRIRTLQTARCGHGVLTIDCDECRFEVGAVKLDPELAHRLMDTATAERGRLSRTLRLTGEVGYDETRVVDVLPSAGGRVVQVHAYLGQQVEQGQMLAVIHSGEFGEAKAAYLEAYTQLELARKEQERRTAVHQALGELLARLEENGDQTPLPDTLASETRVVGEWKARLLGAAAQLRLARSVAERERDLREKRISSGAEVEKAEQELHAAEAEYAAQVEEVRLSLDLEQLRADSAVRQAQAALQAANQGLQILGLQDEDLRTLEEEEAGEGFAWLPVRAPRSGVIVKQEVSQGRFVEPSERLYTVADVSNLWVWCDLYERDLAALQEGLEQSVPPRVAVEVPSFPEETFPGTLDLVGSALDEHTRTVKVRIQVPNQQARLRPGMFASVEILLTSDRQGLLVPRPALLRDEGQSFVFQRWKEDLWVRRDVTPEAILGDLVAVRGDISHGVTIASRGAFMLKSDVLRNKMGAG